MSQDNGVERLQQSELNKAVVTRYIEGLWNNRQYDLIDEILAPDLIAHSSDGNAEYGNQRFRQVIPSIWSAVPDLHLAIEHLIAEDDTVAFRLRVTGTHLAEYAGIPPMGGKLDFAEWFFMRLSQAKITECWYIRDQEMLTRQMTS